MFVHQAGRAFKLYTLFLYETERQNSQEIKIDYEDWYRRSSRRPPSRRDNSRRIRNLHRTAVRDSIYYLRKKGLVKFEPYKGVIEVLDIEDDNYIHVPEEFWEYNWSGLLSTRAAYFYFINLAEFKESSIKPFWFASQPMLSSKYFISDRALGLAAKELMRYNLIEIRHDIPDPGQAFWDRKANRYFINPLYNPEELEICWQELEKRHGDLYHQARKLATRINEPHDPKVVASLIMLIKIYGIEAVKEAVDKATRLSFSHGKWELRYIIGILQRDFSKRFFYRPFQFW